MLNFRFLSGTILFLFISAFAVAQKNATVKGKITDREGNAIEFANIYVKSQGVGTFTDRYGKFKLESEVTTTDGKQPILFFIDKFIFIKIQSFALLSPNLKGRGN